MDYQEDINKFGKECADLVERYREKMPPYEVVHQLIALGTSMSLCCAPNELVGIKTILACVENGIAAYEETHS